MKTSRLEGILVIETSKPYKVAVNGEEQDRNVVVLRDVTSAAEDAAFDLEQLFASCIFDMSQKQSNANADANDDAAFKSFIDDNSPSASAVNDQAGMYELMLKTTRAVKLSEAIEAFSGIISAGLVASDTGDAIRKGPGGIWEKLDRRDKLRIVCSYVAFFVNPLESLQNIQPQGSSEGNKDTAKL